MTSSIVPQFKICTQCSETFPATTEYFNKDCKAKDGLHSWCKACRRANRLRYRVEHPEKVRASNARWRANHPEEIRTSKARYRASHPEVGKANWHRRKARKLELPNNLTAQDWQCCLEYWGDQCAYCGKEADFWTQIAPDHYIALKDPRADNPGTVAANIIPACHARKDVPAGMSCCNNSKGNRDPVEWLIERFGKRKAREIQRRIEAYFAWVNRSVNTP